MASLETYQITVDEERDLTQFNLNLLLTRGQARKLIGGQGGSQSKQHLDQTSPSANSPKMKSIIQIKIESFSK